MKPFILAVLLIISTAGITARAANSDTSQASVSAQSASKQSATKQSASKRSATRRSKNVRPNVLLILVDDLNDYIGSLGGHPQVQTPNLDRLAAQSVEFTSAHTNTPVCQPSRNSLFTGVYPHTSKDFGWTALHQHPELKHNKTWLQILKANNYQMFGTGKLLHTNQKKLWDEWGVPEGINYGPHAFNGNKITGHPSVPSPFRNINIVDGSFAPLSDVPVFAKSDEVTSKSDKTTRTPGWSYPRRPFHYIDEQNRDLLPDEQHARWASEKLLELANYSQQQPFFMGVGLVRPHTPLYAPKRFFDMYPLDEIILPKIQKNDLADSHFQDNYPGSQMGLSYFQALKQSYGDDEQGLKRVLQAYLACISFMDEQLGLILDALESSSLKDYTMVVFTSDHGWQMGEKDYLYKNSPWEESTRIPMLWRIPGVTKGGKKITQPVSLIDIFPTLLELLKISKYDQSNNALAIGGHSLLPLLDSNPETVWPGPNGALTVLGADIDQPIPKLAKRINPQAPWHIKILKPLSDDYVWQQTYTYRTEDWRYIRYKDGQEELYHHLSDPFEWQNLADDPRFNEQKLKLLQQMTRLIEETR